VTEFGNVISTVPCAH